MADEEIVAVVVGFVFALVGLGAVLDGLGFLGWIVFIAGVIICGFGVLGLLNKR